MLSSDCKLQTNTSKMGRKEIRTSEQDKTWLQSKWEWKWYVHHDMSVAIHLVAIWKWGQPITLAPKMLISLYDSVLLDIFSPKWAFIASCTVSYWCLTEVSTDNNPWIGLTQISVIFSFKILILSAREKSWSAHPCSLGMRDCVSSSYGTIAYLVASPEPSEACQTCTCAPFHQGWGIQDPWVSW